MTETYNPHQQGSATRPTGKDSVSKETRADIEKAENANRLHRAANKIAERGRK